MNYFWRNAAPLSIT